MPQQAAVPIIQTPVDRIGQLTDEVLPDQNPFNQPDVIRVRFRAARALALIHRIFRLASPGLASPNRYKRYADFDLTPCGSLCSSLLSR